MSEANILTWQQRARVLRIAGFSYDVISAQVSVHANTLKRLLDPEQYAVVSNGMDPVKDDSFIAPHRPRRIRQLIDRRILRDATVAFANGELRRDELMELVTL